MPTILKVPKATNQKHPNQKPKAKQPATKVPLQAKLKQVPTPNLSLPQLPLQPHQRRSKAMQLSQGVHLGMEADHQNLIDLEFYILVGVTGVGKTTTLAALKAIGVHFNLLPDRRIVTDAAIFNGQTITNRETRFARTAEYRKTHPGGMAQALEQVFVQLESPILFDGLRGLNEVKHAAKTFLSARFIALDAPDLIRVKRLLTRHDDFDTTSSYGAKLNEITGIHEVFSKTEILLLEQLKVSPEELEAKVRIVITERQNYDPKAANAYLNALNPKRVLYQDTSLETPEQIAANILNWMQS